MLAIHRNNACQRTRSLDCHRSRTEEPAAVKISFDSQAMNECRFFLQHIRPKHQILQLNFTVPAASPLHSARKNSEALTSSAMLLAIVLQLSITHSAWSNQRAASPRISEQLYVLRHRLANDGFHNKCPFLALGLQIRSLCGLGFTRIGNCRRFSVRSPPARQFFGLFVSSGCFQPRSTRICRRCHIAQVHFVTELFIRLDGVVARSCNL